MKRNYWLTLCLLVASAAHSQASVQVTSPAPTAPRCMIDSTFGNFHTGTDPSGAPVGIIWCDDQQGLQAWTATFIGLAPSPACQAQLNAFQWAYAWLLAAWNTCAVGNVATGPQVTFAAQLIDQWLPRLAVTTPKQNVYTMKTDGTQGPQLVVAGVGEQIAGGATCAGITRLKNAGARYADVSGQTSTNGVVLPAGSYALCTISYPPAAGWPPI